MPRLKFAGKLIDARIELDPTSRFRAHLLNPRGVRRFESCDTIVRRSNAIELPDGERIPILYEDRSTLAIDKPRGWMLVPFSWQRTDRNLQAALTSSIAAGDFWARSRNLKFLRYVHRLDADTTGILLFARSRGAVETYSQLFETRRMRKSYLAVVEGTPSQKEWTCRLPIGPEPGRPGKMKIDNRHGKSAETAFRVLRSQNGRALVEASPYTGRTHQIRLHLAAARFPVLGDELYGDARAAEVRLALRATLLAYVDPFTKRRVEIRAPAGPFLTEFGFSDADLPASDEHF